MFSKYKYYFYLLFIVVIGYWPFVFFQSALLHDNIDVALSTKYFASECYHNGILPLWNPYQLFGFPAHADLQYTNWNLETILVSLIFEYDYIALHIIFIIYLYLGILGMFLLSKYLSQSVKTAFVIASVYVLSGIFSAHTQSLVTILGLVWLPYVFLFFLKWLRAPSVKTTSALLIFFYLFFTHGYQAFAFMILPIFISLFIHQCYVQLKVKTYIHIKQLVIYASVAIVCLGVLLSPIVISQIQSQQFVNRLNGMSVSDVMDNPFPILGLLSLINPLFTIGHDAWFNTEITMRTIFLGAIFTPIIFISLFKKQKSTLAIIFLSFFLLFFLASFGDVLPVRKIAYYILPGFKLFRFPSLIRVVSILCLLCYVSIYYQWVITKLSEIKKYRNYTFLVLFLILSLSIGFVFREINGNFSSINFNNGFKNGITAIPINQLIYYALCIQLIITTILWIITSSNFIKLNFEKTFAIAVIIELILMLNIYGQFTSFSEVKPLDLQANLNKLQKGFPYPSKDAIGDNVDKFKEVNYLWKNTGGFKKQLIVNDHWTSFYFANFNNLTENHQKINDFLNTQSFLYASHITGNEKKVSIPIDTSANFINNTAQLNRYPVNYQFLNFNANGFSIKVTTSDTILLNTLQSYYTGWVATIDNQTTDIYLNAGLLMSVCVKPGKHIVSFSYSNTTFSIALVTSYLLFALLLIITVYNLSVSNKIKYILSSFILIFVVSLFVIFHNNKNRIPNITKNIFIINKHKINTYNFNDKATLSDCLNYIGHCNNDTISYKWSNFYHSPELWWFLGLDSINDKNYLSKLNGNIHFIKKDKVKKRINKELFALVDTAFFNKINQSLILSHNNPYSVKINANSYFTNNKLFGVVTLKSPFNKRSKPVVCCIAKFKNGEEKNYYFDLNSYFLQENKWQKIPFYFTFDKVDNDVSDLFIFIMNHSENDIELKEISF